MSGFVLLIVALDLAGAAGDAINAVLAAVGYNFRRLLAWLALLFALISHTLRAQNMRQPA